MNNFNFIEGKHSKLLCHRFFVNVGKGVYLELLCKKLTLTFFSIIYINKAIICLVVCILWAAKPLESVCLVYKDYWK